MNSDPTHYQWFLFQLRFSLQHLLEIQSIYMPHHCVNLVCYYIQHLCLPLFLFNEHSCLTAVFPNLRVFPYHYAFFPRELPVAVVSSWQFMFPSEVDTTLFLRFEIHQHRLANQFAADIALSYNNRNCFLHFVFLETAYDEQICLMPRRFPLFLYFRQRRLSF